jgi:hypothetical protein
MALVLDGNGTMTVGNGDITGLVVGALPSNVIGTGAVLQVVQAYITSTFSTNLNTGGWADITGLSVSITPSSTSSKIFIFANLTDCSTTAASSDGMFQVLRGATAVGNADSGGTAPVMAYASTYNAATGGGVTNFTDTVCFTYLDSPSTTSSTTYKVQCRLWNNTAGLGNDGTLWIGRRASNSSFSSPSSITVMEIAA